MKLFFSFLPIYIGSILFFSSLAYAQNSTYEISRSSNEANREWQVETYSSPEVVRTVIVQSEPVVIVREAQTYEEIYHSSAPEPVQAPVPAHVPQTGFVVNFLLFFAVFLVFTGLLVFFQKRKFS